MTGPITKSKQSYFSGLMESYISKLIRTTAAGLPHSIGSALNVSFEPLTYYPDWGIEPFGGVRHDS